MALKSEIADINLQTSICRQNSKIRKSIIKKSVKSAPIALQFAAKIRKSKIHQKSVKLPPMALP
jgi:hypothetical protein